MCVRLYRDHRLVEETFHPVCPVVTKEPQKSGDTMNTQSAELVGWNGEGFPEEVWSKLRPQDHTGKWGD